MVNKIKKKIFYTVGTTVYNEESNIGHFINAVEKQKTLPQFYLKEIIIIASGCTDNTIEIVKEKIKHNKKINLIIQKEREGKASAVNLLFKRLRTKYVVLQSADTIPDKNCYKLILKKLTDKRVGMVGGRVIPKDDMNTFLGYANHFKWQLHHDINIKYPERPKLGELIAFKKIFSRIPPNTAVDEASIEPLIRLQEYQTSYIPKARIFNTGPKTIREYLSQRRRIFAGHYETKIKYGYEVITFGTFHLIPLVLTRIKPNIRDILYTCGTISMEIVARTFGYFDIKYKLRNHTVWKVVSTSKRL